jgi:hypothetical protein
MYASYKDEGLGLKSCEDKCNTYKIHHIAFLLKTEHGRRIMKGYGKLFINQRLSAFQTLIPVLDHALEKLNLE